MSKAQNTEQAKAFLNQYRDNYQSGKILTGAAAEEFAARKRWQRNEVPEAPIANQDARFELSKWYSYDESGLVAFYDDGGDIPEETDLVVVSQSFAMASASGIELKAQSWVLKRAQEG